MIRAIIISILITFTIGYPHVLTSDQRSNTQSTVRKNVTEIVMNDSFDKNLPSIKEFILSNEMDPMKMPDCLLPFKFPFNLGKIHLQHGWVQNLVTIRRTGDVIVRYDKSFMKFDFNLGWNNIDLTYDYTMRYLGITRKGLFHGRFNDINLKMEGSMNMKNREIKLDFLKIIDVEDFTLKLEGHIADHLINIITKLLTVFSKERVLLEIEYQSTKIIQEKIKEINESNNHNIDIITEDNFLFEKKK